MRIALVHDAGSERGGIETYLDLVAAGLGQRGHTVWRADPRTALAARGGIAADAASAPGEIDVVHVHRLEDPEAITEIARRVPAVWSIHDHRPFCPGANRLRSDGSACVRAAGAPCALEGILGRCSGLARWPRATVRRVSDWSRYRAALASRAPCVVASAFMRDVAASQGHAARDLVVLPYPVVPPAEIGRTAADARGVLFAGRLVEPDKGLALLVDVLARLPPTIRAVVAGGGSARRWLEARLAEAALGARVELVGWLDRDALAHRLSDAAVVVMTSAWPEPSGLVGLEALAHGRPVVATDVGGIGEWLAEGVVGHRVPPGDPVAMADRIRVLLGDPARREAMGRAGRAWMLAHRSLAGHVRALEGLYARVAHRTREARSA
ncbi:MAG: glycosyltransferase family 4 protein [bacterium]